jgi:hypothetical protein
MRRENVPALVVVLLAIALLTTGLALIWTLAGALLVATVPVFILGCALYVDSVEDESRR